MHRSIASSLLSFFCRNAWQYSLKPMLCIPATAYCLHKNINYLLLDIDDCVSNLCEHGATCVDGVTEYTCSCALGYSGTYCETGIVTVWCVMLLLCLLWTRCAAYFYCSWSDIDECVNHTCVNNATCVDAVYGYTCSCVDGFTGTHCEVGKEIPSRDIVGFLNKTLFTLRLLPFWDSSTKSFGNHFCVNFLDGFFSITDKD